MMKNVLIRDKVVFVTGTSRTGGIGRALVEEAIRRGARKVYASARKLSQIENFVEKFQGKVVGVELDVTNIEHIKEVASFAKDTQVLINNAGISGFSGCIYNYQETVARNEFEINVFGPLNLMHFFSKNISHGNGAIVNIISIGAFMPYPPCATYSASKAALYSLTQAARIEMAPLKIAVFGVYPGPIDTDMSKDLKVKKELPENVAKRIFEGMEKGIEDITTDALSDVFSSCIKRDPKILEAVKKEFVPQL